MSQSIIELDSRHPVPVATTGGAKTISAYSGDTVYYGNDPQVSSSSNLGSLTVGGGSVTVTGPTWVLTASSSTLLVVDSAPVGDVTLGNDGLLGGPGGTQLTGTVVHATSRALNVLDYGALGTGVAEPATPFQNAYNAATVLGRDVYIPPGTYLIDDVATGALFKLARDNARTAPKVRIIFDPGVTVTFSAHTPRLTDFNKIADYDWFRQVEFIGNGATLDFANVGGIHHALAGTLQAGVNQSRINYERLYFRNFRVVNLFTDSGDGTTNLRHAAWISPLGSAGTDTYGNFIEFEDIDIAGGHGGITLGNAGSTSKFHWDRVYIRRCRHDRGLVSETFAAADSFYIGSRGVGGQGAMEHCYSRGAPDTAYEINGAHQAVISHCIAEDPLNNGFLHRGASGGLDPVDPASKTAYVNCETRRIARTGAMRHMKFGVDTAGDFSYGVVEVQGGGADIQRNDDLAVLMYSAASPNQYRMILLKDQDVYVKGTATNAGAAIVTSTVYIDLGNGGLFKIRGLSIHYEGVVGIGAGYTRRGLDARGNWILDWEGIRIDDQQTFTGGTPGIRGATFGIALNGVDNVTKSEVRGRVKNFKVGGSQGTGLEIGSFSVQQFSGTDLLLLDDIDCSDMQAGASSIVTSGTNLQKVVATNVRQRGNPAAPSVVASATLSLPAFNPPGDLIQVTGVTGITAITAAWVGRVVRLQIVNACTLTDNGTTLNLATNFVGPGYLTLYCDGTNWTELTRSTP